MKSPDCDATAVRDIDYSVSPYLRRRLRSYAEVIGERADQEPLPRSGPDGDIRRVPGQTGKDDADPC